METARREGMVTMDHALKEAYEAGRISFEDAMRFVINPRTIVPVQEPGAPGTPPGIRRPPGG
jgi:Tfp pilus assembly pilus retraction ATPase PilT